MGALFGAAACMLSVCTACTTVRVLLTVVLMVSSQRSIQGARCAASWDELVDSPFIHKGIAALPEAEMEEILGFNKSLHRAAATDTPPVFIIGAMKGGTTYCIRTHKSSLNPCIKFTSTHAIILDSQLVVVQPIKTKILRPIYRSFSLH